MPVHRARRLTEAGTARGTAVSPIGTLILEASDAGLRRILLPNAASPSGVAPVGADSTEALRSADRQLGEYFAGSRRHFDLELAPVGTPFQRSVWFALADIPYAGTISYSELAARVGRPSAFRAVGQANGANPLPIVLPCHRVIASGGGLGGYSGGLDVKRQLLDLERSVFAGRAPARLAV